MSYRALAWAVEQDVPSTHAFAVLCALAGYAGETGECWPSQAALSAKTKQTERSVRNQIAALVESGHIEKAIVQGRAGFRLLVDRKQVPVAGNDVPVEGNDIPGADAATPETGSSPPEPYSAGPEPYSAEPVTESVRNKDSPPKPPEGGGEIEIPPWLPPGIWKTYCDHRGRRFTAAAKSLVIGQLDDWRQAGHDPTEILSNSIMNGWKGIFAPKEHSNGHTGKTSGPHEHAGSLRTVSGRTGAASSLDDRVEDLKRKYGSGARQAGPAA
jgi:Helix-turn-helix domain